MIYVEAPEILRPSARLPKLFLAGGITDCPDWQSRAHELCRYLDIVVLNPRRANFLRDPSADREQIAWEHIALRRADVILFWFCEEAIQPISLYELGAWSMTSKRLAVGAHPNYARRPDVLIQTELVRPDVQVQDTLGGTLTHAWRELGVLNHVPDEVRRTLDG